MSTAMETIETETPAKVLEAVLGTGDLSKLTTEQRVIFYQRTCDSLGLNSLTRPFDFLTLNGKTVLYAKRDATDQLRSTRKVSVDSLESKFEDDLCIVTVRVSIPGGRTDAATGAVAIANLKGEAKANAIMKAETKAKRRATLSICGLGFLDETEVETIPSARLGEPTDRPPVEMPKRRFNNAPPLPPVPPQKIGPDPIAYVRNNTVTQTGKEDRPLGGTIVAADGMPGPVKSLSSPTNAPPLPPVPPPLQAPIPGASEPLQAPIPGVAAAPLQAPIPGIAGSIPSAADAAKLAEARALFGPSHGEMSGNGIITLRGQSVVTVHPRAGKKGQYWEINATGGQFVTYDGALVDAFNSGIPVTVGYKEQKTGKALVRELVTVEPEGLPDEPIPDNEMQYGFEGV